VKVPGFILGWKTKRDESGRLASEVERVKDENSQREITRLLKERYPQVTQIEFL
jgi:short-subunit dehydrogenase involved in D-alanine esterification of teichoic acids